MSSSDLERDFEAIQTSDEGREAHDRPLRFLSFPDRRRHMARLAAALDIRITFVGGLLSENPVVPWIMERLLDEQIAGESFVGPLEDMPQEKRWGEKGGLTW